MDRDQLEDRMGFHKGRLERGGVIAIMYAPDLVTLKADDFSFGASTRWSRSRSSVAWAPEAVSSTGRMCHDAIERRLESHGQDTQELKSKALDFFRTGRENIPAKVFLEWKHESGMDYPDAEQGVPQFRLHREVKWVVARVILPRSGAV